MKKVLAIFVSMIFLASLSIAVLGCKEAPKQEAAPTVEAPAATPATPGAPGAPGAAGTPGAAGAPGAPAAGK